MHESSPSCILSLAELFKINYSRELFWVSLPRTSSTASPPRFPLDFVAVLRTIYALPLFLFWKPFTFPNTRVSRFYCCVAGACKVLNGTSQCETQKRCRGCDMFV